MSNNIKVKLDPSIIKSIPLDTYSQDFTFIVNGEEFKTSRLVAELISPAIGRIHRIDPTFDRITVSTDHSGDFRLILELASFEEVLIKKSDLHFIGEVVEQLENDRINSTSGWINDNDSGDDNDNDITVDEAISQLKVHENFGIIYRNRIGREIGVIARRFSEMSEENEEEVSRLSSGTLKRIICHEELRLSSEDQLLRFVNKVYARDASQSDLYGHVIFANVKSESIREFVEVFDPNDMSGEMWRKLTSRLSCEVSASGESSPNERYNGKREKSESLTFVHQNGSEFNGIINFLSSKSNGNIDKEVGIKSSSVLSQSHHPRNVAIFGDDSKFFYSKNEQNSWISFDFKEHRVRMTDYTIKSRDANASYYHPKSWVMEGSNNESEWTIIDERTNNAELNGAKIIRTFKVCNPTTNCYRYIRMRQTGPNWSNNDNRFTIISLELYGQYF